MKALGKNLLLMIVIAAMAFFSCDSRSETEKFDILNDPKEVIIDFQESRVVDMSAIEALNKITERYMKVGKKVHLKHLSKDCLRLLKNAEDIIEVNVMEDPTYKVVVDKI